MMLTTYWKIALLSGLAVTSFDFWTSPEHWILASITAVAVWSLFTKGKKDETRKELDNQLNITASKEVTIQKLHQDMAEVAKALGESKVENAEQAGEIKFLRSIGSGDAFITAMQAGFKESSEKAAEIHAASSRDIVTAVTDQTVALKELTKALKLPTRAPSARSRKTDRP